MKPKLRKISSLFLVIILISTITLSPITVSALTQSEFDSKLNSLRSKYPNYSTWYNSFDGGSQCFGFARLMGYEVFGSYPSTWSVSYDFNSVKAGDIIRYGNNGSGGHSIFVTNVSGSTITFVDCNGNGNYSSGTKVRTCGIKWDNKTTIGSRLFGYGFSYIRKSPGIELGNNPSNPVDLGTDFYAYIINTKTWLHATNNDNGNVIANTLTGASNQIWYFERLNNGSYKITSCKDSRCMEVHNFETSNGTNVEINNYGDNSAQHWFIYGNSSQYMFKAECGNNVLDLSGGTENATSGANLQMWENNGTDAQRFQIWKLDKPNLGIANVSVSNFGGENGENVKLYWNECNEATGYDVRIYDETGKNNLYIYYNVHETSLAIKIPSGNYIAEVTALNNKFNCWRFGTKTPFSCANNFGTDFYAYIINTKTWLHATKNNDDNITANSVTGEPNQIWYFERLNNGSYKITSCEDGRCMEVHNFETSNGTNVEINNYGDNSAQHWFIYGNSSQYIFKAECGNNVLDLSGGTENATSGANLQMWENNGTDAQRFQIWILNKPEETTVSCDSGSNVVPTKFMWNDTKDTLSYELKIWKDKAEDIPPYLTVACKLDNKYEVILPAGHYEAYIISNNYIGSTMSNIIEFDVKLLGDVNSDNEISILDATELQKYVAELSSLNDEQLAVADVNGDGQISVLDATEIQKYLAELIPSLG